MILHDPVVDRVSSGTGPVGEFSLQQLRDFDCGIPTFDEALEAIPDSVGLNIQVEETDAPPLEAICGIYTGHKLAGRAYLTVSTFEDALRVRKVDPSLTVQIT